MIGTGYVGLTSGACFADEGHNVICVDINQKRIDELQQGKIPFYEPGLEEIVLRNSQNGRLRFTTLLEMALQYQDILFLCLPTPKDLKSKTERADLSYIKKAAHDAGKLKSKWGGYRLFVNKSTVPAGTNKMVMDILQQYASTAEFGVASNPEFLKEGEAVRDFQNPDRIVVGVNTKKDEKLMRQLYASHQNKSKILVMKPVEAELVKYGANGFLATKISYVNDLARLCDALDANIENVREGICSDSRIGDKFFWPSSGYGGSCFPKDVREMIGFAQDFGHPLQILEATEDINKSQKRWFGRKIAEYFGRNLKGKQFAMWGLAFKPKTDDVRESTSIELIRYLTKLGAVVKAYDPEAGETAKTVLLKKVHASKFQILDKKYDVLAGSDALIVPTEWGEFRTPDFTEIKNALKNPVIFDGKNIYGRDSFLVDQMKKMEFDYIGVGCSYRFKK